MLSHDNNTDSAYNTPKDKIGRLVVVLMLAGAVFSAEGGRFHVLLTDENGAAKGVFRDGVMHLKILYGDDGFGRQRAVIGEPAIIDIGQGANAVDEVVLVAHPYVEEEIAVIAGPLTIRKRPVEEGPVEVPVRVERGRQVTVRVNQNDVYPIGNLQVELLGHAGKILRQRRVKLNSDNLATFYMHWSFSYRLTASVWSSSVKKSVNVIDRRIDGRQVRGGQEFELDVDLPPFLRYDVVVPNRHRKQFSRQVTLIVKWRYKGQWVGGPVLHHELPIFLPEDVGPIGRDDLRFDLLSANPNSEFVISHYEVEKNGAHRGVHATVYIDREERYFVPMPRLPDERRPLRVALEAIEQQKAADPRETVDGWLVAPGHYRMMAWHPFFDFAKGKIDVRGPRETGIDGVNLEPSQRQEITILDPDGSNHDQDYGVILLGRDLWREHSVLPLIRGNADGVHEIPVEDGRRMLVLLRALEGSGLPSFVLSRDELTRDPEVVVPPVLEHRLQFDLPEELWSRGGSKRVTLVDERNIPLSFHGLDESGDVVLPVPEDSADLRVFLTINTQTLPLGDLADIKAEAPAVTVEDFDERGQWVGDLPYGSLY